MIANVIVFTTKSITELVTNRVLGVYGMRSVSAKIIKHANSNVDETNGSVQIGKISLSWYT